MAENDERGFAAVVHILGLITGFIGPLIVFLIKEEEGLVKDQAREALNFQIAVLIAFFVSSILALVLIGLVLLVVVGIVDLIFCIMGAVRANNGERFRYPVNIRFIKGPEGTGV